MDQSKTLEEALKKIEDLDPTRIGSWRYHLEAIQRMAGGDRILSRFALAQRQEDLLDCWAEIQYALIFLGLHFEVEMEPCAGGGPDLRIRRDGHEAFVEVKRFRRMYPGPPESTLDDNDPNPMLQMYGNPSRDKQKVWSKITEAFRQVEGMASIVAIWNDDGDLEEVETEWAVNDIRRGVARGWLKIPKDLLFVLYGSDWFRGHGSRQLFCYAITDIGEPYRTWITEIENLRVVQTTQQAVVQLRQIQDGC